MAPRMRPSPADTDLAPPHHSPSSVTRIVARAPTRIDFGGGWTDVPPYPERDGGFVCNVAIARHARVLLEPGVAGENDPLARAALRRAGLHGAISVENDFPVGAGLGGSSAAGVAIQAALAVARGTADDPESLVQHSRAVEVEELGVAGGWQDHYAAAYGGALGLSFGQLTTVQRIPVAADFAATLERGCLLAYTGQSRISSANITAVLDAYAAREPRVLAALQRMAKLAHAMTAALHDADIAALAALVAEHWVNQRALHPAITTDRIDAIIARATAAGAGGAKALGASGGGCVLIVAPRDPERVAAAIADLCTLLPFSVDFTGAAVEAAT